MYRRKQLTNQLNEPAYLSGFSRESCDQFQALVQIDLARHCAAVKLGFQRIVKR